MKKPELLIVEGKSAKLNLTKAINRNQHQVHAVQGKLLNVNKHLISSVLADVECQQLIDVLGCGFDKTLDIKNLPFSSVCILMDPDIDGAHSSALLLSFFNRYYQPLVFSGFLSLIKLPLFRIGDAGPQATFAWSPDELATLLKADSIASGQSTNSANITRYKGVAQFSLAECEQHMLNAKSRRLVLLR